MTVTGDIEVVTVDVETEGLELNVVVSVSREVIDGPVDVEVIGPATGVVEVVILCVDTVPPSEVIWKGEVIVVSFVLLSVVDVLEVCDV